jgi:hypothetical protein
MDLITLRRKLDAISIEDAQLRTPKGNHVSNFRQFKDAVRRLALIPQLSELAQEIQTDSLFDIDGDDFQTDGASVSRMRSKADELFRAAATLKYILHETVPQVQPETVILTIPSQKDLKTTTELLEEFRKSLSPLVFEPGIDGKLDVIRWESGSLLVFLLVGTMAAVRFIARALQAAAIAYQEVQKGRAAAQHVELLKEHVRGSKIKNEVMEVIAQAQKDRIKEVVAAESKAVELEIFGDTTNERLERIKLSVKTLAELLEQGATVTPALEMPAEDQAKFPDIEHLLTVGPSVKQIENGGSSDENALQNAPQ